MPISYFTVPVLDKFDRLLDCWAVLNESGTRMGTIYEGGIGYVVANRNGDEVGAVASLNEACSLCEAFWDVAVKVA